MSESQWRGIPGTRIRYCVLHAPSEDARPQGANAEYWHDRVASDIGIDPEEFSIISEQGKAPEAHLAGRSICLSYSTTFGGRACAWSDSGSLGVDVEQRRPYAESESMLEIAGCDDEIRSVGMELGWNQAELLLRNWTAKEAVLKAAGVGLSVDPRSVTLAQMTVAGGSAMLLDRSFTVRWFDERQLLLAVASN